jgi:hypothetical protein
VKFAYRSLAARIGTLLVCAGLMGCGSAADMRDKLGLNREGPDEYRVVPRPPLSVPPEFNLRPPGQASEYVSGMPAQTRAHAQVLGGDAAAAPDASAQPAAGSNPFASTGVAAAVAPVTSGPLPSSSDSQFLANAGAGKTDPQIRQKLLDDQMNGTGGVKDPNYLFGGKTQSDSVVDAAKEADRLKQDKQENKPPTAGDTPVVVPEDKGILGTIF